MESRSSMKVIRSSERAVLNYEPIASRLGWEEERREAERSTSDLGIEESHAKCDHEEQASSSRTITEVAEHVHNLNSQRRPNIISNVFSLLSRSHVSNSQSNDVLNGSVMHAIANHQVAVEISSSPCSQLEGPIIPPSELQSKSGKICESATAWENFITAERTLKILEAGGLSVVGDKRPALQHFDKIIDDHKRESIIANEVPNMDC